MMRSRASTLASLQTWTALGSGSVALSVETTLRWIIRPESYGAVGDGVTDDRAAILAAIAAAPAAGARIVFRAGVTYLISTVITLTRGNLYFCGDGEQMAEIKCSSTTSDHFAINAAGAAVFYNVYFEGLLFSRSSACTAGYVLNVVNLGYGAMRRCRIYGDSKQFRGVKLTSTLYFDLEDCDFNNIKKEHVWLVGGTAAAGTTDGRTQDITAIGCRFDGAHAGSASPTTESVIYAEDNVEALFLTRNQVFNHVGFGLRLAGTAPNAARNTLIYIDDFNVESGNNNAGAIHTDYFSNVIVWVRWLSGKILPAIQGTVNTNRLHIIGGQIAAAGAGGNGITFAGTGLIVSGVHILGYDASVGDGINLASTAQDVTVSGGEITAMNNGVVAATTVGRRYTIDCNVHGNISADYVGFPATSPVWLRGIGAPYNYLGSNGVAGPVVSISATGGVGYATGAGGAVTQGAGSGKATAVTLSKVCGQITTDNAALAANTTVSFVLTNTAIAATDVLALNHVSGGTVGAYTLNAQCAAGSATINIRNVTAGSLSEALVISFVLIKGVTS